MGVGKAIGALVVGGVAVFAGTQGLDDNTTRDDAGRITESGGLGAFVVQIGDCVNDPGAEVVQSFEGVPCSDPHFAQAYASFDLTGHDSFPTESALDHATAEGCLAEWTAAIGTVYESDQELDFVAMSPTEESWQEGDREVICFVTAIDGQPLIGSRLRST